MFAIRSLPIRQVAPVFGEQFLVDQFTILVIGNTASKVPPVSVTRTSPSGDEATHRYDMFLARRINNQKSGVVAANPSAASFEKKSLAVLAA